MKTLLIDNDDSHTYNVFQLLAEVNGTEPVVIRNDVPSCDLPDLREFGNVVVSSGPGHPGRPADFGISASVLAASEIPVLGVGLGHQGIAVGERGTVTDAPQGHLCRIRHDGEDLFRGLPQDFTAVRTHPLAVGGPLPASLRGTAWAEDGLLMALRHRTRPQWGVQFHPESVLTEFGHRLLLNFRYLTADWPRPAGSRPGRARTTGDTPTAFVPRPRRCPPVGHRLHTRRIATAVDAGAAFARMCGDAPRAFLLEGSRAEEGSRFTYFGDGDGPLAEFVRYDSATGVCEVERPGRPTRKVRANVFDHLKRQLATRRVDAGELPFDLTGGYVGFVGTPAGARSPLAGASAADSCWLFADRLVVVDHRDGVTHAVCLAENTLQGARDASEWLNRAVAQLSCVPSERTEDSPGRAPSDAAGAPGAPADRVPRAPEQVPYTAFLRFGEVGPAVPDASPERFLRVTRDGVVRARTVTCAEPEQPEAGASEGSTASRDGDAGLRAAHVAAVDLLRNDLGRVCAPGTVRVPSLMADGVRAGGPSTVSTVKGGLRPGADAVDCVRACFPAGPAAAARAPGNGPRETGPRGGHARAVGYLGCGGGADFGPATRTDVGTDGRAGAGTAGDLGAVPGPARGGVPGAGRGAVPGETGARLAARPAYPAATRSVPLWEQAR
ncbi:glutamine amidotransferase-related protein [Streptomyces fructofermentans]|uniref:Aminodeoxychorismate synthase, component I n=1 Tax=Streptomyces fructofermentans TaxID=152141 RepID=A0A918U2P0_9ACTN|nr:chorismate-binding protein [Streptomyces fructofermentans]GGX85041.1 aminodeoxychorismate synthase, component I [Streptomyces fructofermentans]